MLEEPPPVGPAIAVVPAVPAVPAIPAIPPAEAPPTPEGHRASREERAFWSRVGGGLAVAGYVVGRAGARAGRAVADAYRSIDPDMRRQLAHMPLLGLTMLTPARPPIAPLPDDGHRPIVFVHGLGGHRGNFLPMRGYLRVLGRSRTYAVGFPEDADLEGMARELRRAIAEILDTNAIAGVGVDARVDLVAHSMGGIVSRIALEEPATAARVATLATLGTPHAGTFLARYASTAHTRALRPDSELIERLRAQLPWAGPPTMPRLVAFWSDADVILLPATSACVEGAENVELSGFSHLSYLLDPRGWSSILRVLSE